MSCIMRTNEIIIYEYQRRRTSDISDACIENDGRTEGQKLKQQYLDNIRRRFGSYDAMGLEGSMERGNIICTSMKE